MPNSLLVSNYYLTTGIIADIAAGAWFGHLRS